MLNMSPFTYGLVVEQVYDNGTIYSNDILDVTDDQILSHVFDGVRNIASLSLAIGYPTTASVHHSIINGYKNVLGIALATDYSFPRAEKAKEYLKDPSKFAAAAPPAKKEEKKEDKKEDKKAEKKEEKKAESEEEADMGFGLFD